MIATLFAQAPAPAPVGVVEGGWSYVVAAYAATWLFFIGYAVSLAMRRKAVEQSEAASRREEA